MRINSLEQLYLSTGDRVKSDAEPRILDGEQARCDTQHLRPIEVSLGVRVLKIEALVPSVHAVHLLTHRVHFVTQVAVTLFELLEHAIAVRELFQLRRRALNLAFVSERLSHL